MALTLLLGLGGGLSVAAGAEGEAVKPLPAALDPGRLGWQTLELRASKLGLSTTSEISFALLPAAQAADQLIAAEGCRPLSPQTETTALVELGSQLFGRRTDTRLLFDPADGAALQRVQHESGKKLRYKVYRFAGSGVYTVWRFPEAEQEELPPERWSDRRDALERYPEQLSPSAVVTEPSALFYLVAAAALDRVGDRLEVVAFSKKQVYRVVATVEAVERIDVDYVEEGAGGRRQVRGQTDALRISLAARPLAGKAEPLRLIGLEGDVDLYLERQHRAPVLVTGKVRVAGRVNVRLQRLVLR